MKKIALLFGIAVIGLYIFYGITTIFSRLNNYSLIEFVIVAITLILLFWLELFLIKKFKKAKKNSNSAAISYREPVETNEIKTDVPAETLNQMRSYYTEFQMQGDLRILQDSIEIMNSTKDIDTFFSRSDLALRTVLTLEQAKNAGFKVNSIPHSSKELMDLKVSLLPNVLENAYAKMSADASKLKTTKGKLGRHQKFLNYLEENEYELDLCDNYEEIVNTIKDEISNFEHQLAINTKG